MTDDVVAELDAWLRWYQDPDDPTAVRPSLWDGVRRARDEIVALREAKLARPSAYDIVRAEALEEAARACIGSGAIVAEARLCAVAIRALHLSPRRS